MARSVGRLQIAGATVAALLATTLVLQSQGGGPFTLWANNWEHIVHLYSCQSLDPTRRVSVSIPEAIDQKWQFCQKCRPDLDPEFRKASDAYQRQKDQVASDAAALARTLAAEEVAMQRPLTPLLEASVRKIAAAAAAASDHNREAFRNRFIDGIRAVDADYKGEFVVPTGDGILITVVGPVGKFQFAVGERVRQFLPPTDGVLWDASYTVSVFPTQITAPDIRRVVLERNGQIVTPLLSTLKPTPMTTRLGAKDVLGQGSVSYGASAFVPGANVVVKMTAIPLVGDNIVYTFTNRELRSIR